MGRLILLLALSWPILGHSNPAVGAELAVVGSTVSPGGLARLSIQWTGLPTTGVDLLVEADPSFTALHTPSLGNSTSGSALILLMVHPFARPGAHTLSVQLLQKGTTLVEGKAVVQIHPKYAVESTITGERPSGLSLQHTNAGNTPITVDGIYLEPGESKSVERSQQQSAVYCRAEGQGWDSSYTLLTTERFFPSATSPKKGIETPRLLLGTTGQWTPERLLLTSSLRWKQGSWQCFASSWNSVLRFQGSYSKGGNNLSIGNGNSSALTLLRPIFSPYARIRLQNGLHSYIDAQSALIKNQWKAGGMDLQAGVLLYQKQLQPIYGVRWGSKKLDVDYRGTGALQQLEVGIHQGIFQGYGRLLAVPQAWQDQTLQRSSASIGGSVHLANIQWNIHSAYQEFSGEWTSFHTSQLQWNKGPWNMNARGMWHESNDFFRGNLQVQYNRGSHTLGIRQRYQKRMAKQLQGWGVQYRWHAAHGQWATTLNRLGDRWSWRAQGGVTIKGLLLQGQGSYASLSKDRWFYQLSLSKTFRGNTISMSSGRNTPVRLGIKGQLLEQSPYKTLGGRVINAQGEGLGGIVLECEGKKVQTDAQGKFRFAHLEKSEVKVAFAADKIPFSFYPKSGFVQEFTLNKKSQNVDIQLYKNCGIRGHVMVNRDGPSFMLPALEWKNLTLFLHGGGKKWQCNVGEQGRFRLSGFPPGQYTLNVGGLGRYFEAESVGVSVGDGEVLDLELQITALAHKIPVQQL